ncbi:helix-turn-helix transcriptional regulator [Microbispora sp. SCL1-1]|uniref:helix-turn-helix domain-containing protein n=1 Tax=unclassified Microbispora TaxID=2614687 RepID=UPI001157151F|nr:MULTISPECIES: helix-turn-helix transcriptional regulator [unclassified Microbispora]NJP28071.1 helix-turn-helix transcriptional regulator [Microbispora sp. CL1-1]TQS09430.1 helix-turn-helix transcriptional regulator [Microbispora sp. SCL1-1]
MATDGLRRQDVGARPPGALAHRRASGDPGSFDRSKQCDKWSKFLPEPAERERLAATLGAALKALRAEYGIGTRPLARRSTVARSTITRLESGQRRPRPAILAAIAYGLDPGRVDELAELLATAAGDSLRPDTPGGIRRRARRTAKARRVAGVVRWRLQREAEQARHAEIVVTFNALRKLPLDPWRSDLAPADLDRLAAQLAAHHEALDESRRLHNRADHLQRVLSRPHHPLETKLDA